MKLKGYLLQASSHPADDACLETLLPRSKPHRPFKRRCLTPKPIQHRKIFFGFQKNTRKLVLFIQEINVIFGEDSVRKYAEKHTTA